MINEIPDRNKIKWETLFPTADPLALDLLDNMLVYDPCRRYTAEQCINHPYLKEIRSKSQLIKCEKVFDFEFDEIERKEESLREALFEEAESFNDR